MARSGGAGSGASGWPAAGAPGSGGSLERTLLCGAPPRPQVLPCRWRPQWSTTVLWLPVTWLGLCLAGASVHGAARLLPQVPAGLRGRSAGRGRDPSRYPLPVHLLGRWQPGTGGPVPPCPGPASPATSVPRTAREVMSLAWDFPQHQASRPRGPTSVPDVRLKSLFLSQAGRLAPAVCPVPCRKMEQPHSPNLNVPTHQGPASGARGHVDWTSALSLPRSSGSSGEAGGLLAVTRGAWHPWAQRYSAPAAPQPLLTTTGP